MEKIEMLVTNLIAAVIKQQRATVEQTQERTEEVLKIRRQLLAEIKELLPLGELRQIAC
jgi:hypothetical protein